MAVKFLLKEDVCFYISKYKYVFKYVLCFFYLIVSACVYLVLFTSSMTKSKKNINSLIVNADILIDILSVPEK